MRFVRGGVLAGTVLVLLFQLGCTGAVGQSASTNSTSTPVSAIRVSSIAPSTVAAGHAAFLLTVSGANFTPQSAIDWNGAALATTFVSSGELTTNIAASSLVQAASVSVEVKDTQSGGISNALSLTVGDPPVITTTALPEGQAGQSYSAPVNVAGGIAPFHWATASGNLPAGLAMNSQTGVISGTAAEPATSSVGVVVTDSVNSRAQADLAIQIVAAGQLSTTGGASTPYYGVGIGTDGLANTTIGPYGNTASYRIRAKHSGTLQQALIYLIPDHPGYSGGTGGKIQVTLHTDDGTAAHNPSSTVLASYVISGAATLPSPARYFYTVKFSSPPSLTAGQIYHMVFKNIDANPTVNFISVDALYQLNPTAPIQQALGNLDAGVLLSDGGGPWNPRLGYTPIYQLSFTNGVTEGVGYIEGWVGAPEPVSGTRAVREAFTVSGSSVKIASVAVRVARVAGNDPLVVRLENANGVLIEQATIPASAIPQSNATAPSYFWASLPFSTTYTLLAGSTYHLDLQSSATSTYETFPIRKGYAYGFQNTTYFRDGSAQFELNASWFGWTQWGTANRTDGDLQFYFSVVP